MNTRVLRKAVLVFVMAALIALFWVFDLHRLLTLSNIKSSQERFAALYADHRLLVLAAYFLVYVLVTSLSLPGAAIMSVAGGALFGFWNALVVVSFASSCGATIAFLVSRYILRDWVQGRFGEKLAAVNRGIDREGIFYLFTLRMIPVFPFFIINLVMGLTRMPARTFYGVSQAGMLPGTMVFVNAGKELGKIDSLQGILSPGLLLSFALLGIFPIAARRLVKLYQDRSGRGPRS